MEEKKSQQSIRSTRTVRNAAPNLSHHVITLWIESIGSTYIHPVVLHLVQCPDIVLALPLQTHVANSNDHICSKHNQFKLAKAEGTHLGIFSFVLTLSFLLLCHSPFHLKE